MSGRARGVQGKSSIKNRLSELFTWKASSANTQVNEKKRTATRTSRVKAQVIKLAKNTATLLRIQTQRQPNGANDIY